MTLLIDILFWARFILNNRRLGKGIDAHPFLVLFLQEFSSIKTL